MKENSDVDSLVEAVQGSIKVSLEDDDPVLIHPRYCQYKKRPTAEICQEERRRDWLKEQKNRRLELKCVLRGIIDGSNEDDDDEEEEEEVENMEVDAKQIKKAPNHKAQLTKDILMLSVWLVDVPDSLKTDWYFTVVPEGRRCLVISHKGQTVAYSRRGDFMMRFPSALPGGHYRSMRRLNSPPTMLDCIWNRDVKTLYVLDVVSWGDLDLASCDAAFRFFWLVSKREDWPELANTSEINRYKFLFLEHKWASDVQQSLQSHPFFPENEPKVDGILFFHKASLYTPGKSPLVTWLKAFMVPDILRIPVHEKYRQEVPLNYVQAMDVEGGK